MSNVYGIFAHFENSGLREFKNLWNFLFVVGKVDPNKVNIQCNPVQCFANISLWFNVIANIAGHTNIKTFLKRKFSIKF